MYSVQSYGQMITDQVRMEPYVEALRRVIGPEKTVLDIGSGTGIIALLACQMGARHVYAIEPASAIEVAREVVAANGYADRVTFYQELSTKVNLPEPADIMISDLRGVLPLLQHHIPSIVDARQRLLKPAGVQIPQRDTLWAAVVSSEKLYEPYTAPWTENPYGLNMRAGSRIVVNTWRKVRIEPEHILCPPQQWTTLDYTSTTSPNVSHALTWTVEDAGTGHGLGVWFDTELLDGIGFSSGPGLPEVIYGMAFFPWQEPVVLEPGDQVTVRLEANLVVDDYIWRWSMQVLGQGNEGHVKADFRQSTFWGVPLTPQSLMKRADHFVPSLNEDGRLVRFVLEQMDSGLSLREIAVQLSERFPHRFGTWNAALSRVSDLSEKYSQ